MEKDIKSIIQHSFWSKQLSLVYSALCNSDSPSPNLFLYSSPGVFILEDIQQLLNIINVKYVTVSCIECCRRTVFFEKLLTIYYHDLRVPRCDSFPTFVKYLISNNQEKKEKLVFILDRVDEINTTMLGDSIMRQFLKLGELTEANISVILTSQVAFKRSKIGANDPLILYFEPPSLQQLQVQAIKDLPKLIEACDFILVPDSALSRFVEIIIQELHPIYPNMVDLKSFLIKLYPKYIEPYCNALELDKSQEPLTVLQKCMGLMISRIQKDVHNILGADSIDTELKDLNVIDLPLVSRYLLLASYIASYIPDFNFSLYTKRTKIIKNKALKRYTGSPRTFNTSKLLSNFDNIVAGHQMINDQDILTIQYISRQSQSAQTYILQQITSLRDLGLINQSSQTMNVQKTRYQTNIDLETAKQIADTISFPLGMYH